MMESKLIKDGLKVMGLVFLFSLLSIYIGLYSPIMGFFINLVLPIPIAYIVSKYNNQSSLIIIITVALTNGLLLGMTGGMQLGAMMIVNTVVGFGLIGFVVGSGVKEGFSPRITLILTVAAVIFSTVITNQVIPYLTGTGYKDVINDIVNIINQNSQFGEFSETVKQIVPLIIRIYPSILIITSIITGIVVYYISTWYLKKKGLVDKIYKPVKMWYFPRILSLGIVIALLLDGNIFFVNLLIVLLFFMFLQGFSVGLFYTSRLKNPIINFLYIMAIVFLNFLLLPVLIILGLFDMWFNLRKFK
ncbi:DUF2232 domain-containing protein [Iocasia frigidifontis]|uniref:DUF2232 domain-containing protein n=2 Tax=Iocasia fonsfrigidae TaxID=2682810 RepID=A0A8A7KJ14_9FIRM|nr:DUF2232 domain-containing protein [Iocasia fonsfrigidae]